jgi:uncharacterized membrane protein YphA (DoxX/SURF4 family)
MSIIFQTSKVISIVAFLVYGLSCLFSQGMAAEFERFGLSRFRRLTGALEVVGALGLLAGYLFAPLVPAASAGLTLLMVLGVITRVRVRDPLVEILPAIVLLLINVFILAHSIRLAASF